MRVYKSLIATLIFAAACGGGETAAPGNTGNTGNTGASGSTSTAIDVNDNNFSPSSTTVPVNATISWTWMGGGIHNVTFATAGITPSGDKTNGGTFQKQFPNAGTFNYACSNHGGMNGSITVQ